MKFKIVFTAVLLMSIPIGSFAQKYSERQRTVKAYKANSLTTLDVENKYGKVQVVTWEKDSLKIIIDLVLHSSNQARLYKLKKSIDFEFSKTKNLIKVKTIFGSNYNTFFSDIKSIANTILSSDNEITINYTLMVPSYAALKIQNKFGDFYADDIHGDFNLNLSNGDLKVNKLMGNTNITLNFGDGVANYIKKGKINVIYSDFHIKKAGTVNIESKSSKVYIDMIKKAIIQSKRDKYFITSVNKISANTYFSDFKINSLTNELLANLKFGTLTLEYISKDFSLINVKSESTDVELYFEKEASYQLDINHSEDVYISYPRNIAKLDQKIINETTKETLTYGTIGTGTGSSYVKIQAPRKCSISIIHK